jgi:CheY-like chemotaxis protein
MTRVLLVDDDELASSSITAVLESGLEVSNARSVPEAMQLIAKEKFDVLLNDLHMPGDGLTAVSAMRQANPRAVTMLLSAFPDMDDATHAILLQPNEIAVEPLDIPGLVEVIKRQVYFGSVRSRIIESVGQIVARTANQTVKTWFKEEKLQSIAMTYEERTNHLHQVLKELVLRLQSHKGSAAKNCYPLPLPSTESSDAKQATVQRC